MSSLCTKLLDCHEDQRGWVSEIYSGELDLKPKNIHLGTIEPGSVRGNHLHDETTEWIAFPETPITIRVGDPPSYTEDVRTEPFRIKLAPGTGHAFKNPGTERIAFAAFTDQKYDSDSPDVRPVELF